MLGYIAFHDVQLAQLHIGESVAAHGVGVIGHLTIQLCRAFGVYPVIAVDKGAELNLTNPFAVN